MTHHEIVTQLSFTCPSNVIFTITMETVITAIVGDMGEETLELSPEDLGLNVARHGWIKEQL